MKRRGTQAVRISHMKGKKIKSCKNFRLAETRHISHANGIAENLIHRLLGELAGSKNDLTAAHMESVQALFYCSGR